MQVSAVLDSGAAQAYAQANGTSVAQLREAAEALPEVGAIKNQKARGEAVDAILAEQIAKNATLLGKSKQIRQAIDRYNGVKTEVGEDATQQETGIAGMERIGYNEGEGSAIEGKATEAQEVHNKLKNFTKFEDALAFVRRTNTSAFGSESLTKLINDVDNISFGTAERATLRSEIIKQSGFANFDRTKTLADVFSFTKVEVVELKNPITLYRRGYSGEPTSRNGLGRWWGDQHRTIDQVRNDLAVCEEWGNPLTEEYSIIVPKGTKVIKGIAASQTITDAAGNIVEHRPGGSVQYWLNDVPNEWLN